MLFRQINYKIKKANFSWPDTCAKFTFAWYALTYLCPGYRFSSSSFLGIGGHVFNPNTLETEEGGSQ